MTGFGEARRQEGSLAISIEVRSINNRYFKISVRSSEAYGSLDSQIEGVIRSLIKRGTVQVQLRVDQETVADDFRINKLVLDSYREQLDRICQQWQLDDEVSVDGLLSLPGVIQDRTAERVDATAVWPLAESTLRAALDGLQRMRVDEGAAIAKDMSGQCATIRNYVAKVDALAPQVVESFRERLTERVNKALGEFHVTVEPPDLVREISLFSEKSDISEELVRLKSHLDQFDRTLNTPESSGRKLEFLAQEMFREANTLGAKANDVQIGQHVIEIKTAIERIREQVQNVE